MGLMGAIYLASGSSDAPQLMMLPDVPAHGVVYAALAVVMLRGLTGERVAGVPARTALLV